MKAKIVLRREIFAVDTFTELSIQILFYRVCINLERPRQRNDISFHIARQFGAKN